MIESLSVPYAQNRWRRPLRADRHLLAGGLAWYNLDRCRLARNGPHPPDRGASKSLPLISALMLRYLPLLEVRRKLQIRVSRDLAIFEKTWCRISLDVKPR